MSDYTVLLTSTVESEVENTPGLRSINLSGEPYAAALLGAVVDNYSRLSGRPKPVLSAELIGEKVTLISAGANMFGSGSIIAREGRLFEGSRGLAILPKGKRSRGYSVNEAGLLDLLPGWRTDEAAALVSKVRAHYPELVNLTQGHLNALPRDSEDCSLALLGHNRVFGGGDCLWLIGEYWPEDDICDTNVLLIRPQFGTSEYGTCYGQELLGNRALGLIPTFEPICFAEALHLCEIDFDDACDQIFQRCGVAV